MTGACGESTAALRSPCSTCWNDTPVFVVSAGTSGGRAEWFWSGYGGAGDLEDGASRARGTLVAAVVHDSLGRWRWETRPQREGEKKGAERGGQAAEGRWLLAVSLLASQFSTGSFLFRPVFNFLSEFYYDTPHPPRYPCSETA